MYTFFRNAFYLSLILYVFTLLEVSYVGVKLTYYALPLIGVLYILMQIMEPKNREKDDVDDFIGEFHSSIISLKKGADDFLDEVKIKLELEEQHAKEFNDMHKRKLVAIKQGDNYKAHDLDRKNAQLKDDLSRRANKIIRWRKWICQNKDKLKHVAGFEERFVNDILEKIPEIEPEDVTAQYHFKGNHGENRFIDFFIKNTTKGYALPIELDGYSKLQINQGYGKFEDFINRQNALIKQFGVLLRFTNKAMINNSNNVIKEIQTTLELQSKNKISADYLNSLLENQKNEFKALLDEKERRIKALKRNKQLLLGGTSLVCVGCIYLVSSNMSYKENLVTTSTALPVATIEKINRNQSSNSPVFLRESSESRVAPITTVKVETTASLSTKESLISPKQQLTTSTDIISDKQAIYNVGSVKTVCGQVYEVKVFSKGVYINFGGSYPNQTFTGVIWDSTPDLVYYSPKYESTQLCINGEITIYKSIPQVIINSVSQISEG